MMSNMTFAIIDAKTRCALFVSNSENWQNDVAE